MAKRKISKVEVESPASPGEVHNTPGKRVPGSLKGMIKIRRGFDALPKDVARALGMLRS